jgi:uncharacterized BrkB/YihY/UPF0761 family membrane protein
MKGQVTIIALVMTLITLVVFSALYAAILKPTIDDFANSTDDDNLIMVVNLIPFLMLISIIIGFLMYVLPQRQVSQY